MDVPDRSDSLRWTATGTVVLLGRLDVVDLAAPSILPGWTHGHVAAHVARNADACGRLLQWARTGVETPMYGSADARNAEIERDARRPVAVQRADVRTTAERLDAQFAGLPETAWGTQIRNAQGVPIPATAVPWLRAKEVWLHSIDLGESVWEFPTGLVDAVLTEVVADFDARPEAPGLSLATHDTGREFYVRGGGMSVTGPAPELMAWLVGRSPGTGLDSDDPLPELPRWL